MATHPQQVGAGTDERVAAAAPPWAPAAGALAAVPGWFARQLREERPRWFLWLPVAQGFGIALYFSLPFEPPVWLGVALALPPLAALAWRRSSAGEVAPYEAPLLAGLAVLAIGFAAAQLRTVQVEAPALARQGVYEVEGRVLFVEERTRGRRLLIGEPRLAGVPAGATPARVRVKVRTAEPELRPGDVVRLRAMLLPPSGPSQPGGFDYARQAYFERLGAVGYAFGAPERPAAGAPVGGADLALARLRQAVTERITAVVPGPAGAVAAALLTGLRGAIPERVWSDMQVAGLAHLLAISGLHLGLVAGTLFLAIRTGLNLAPALALRLPVKKLAAAVALVGSFGYLLLAGATVPTQRAFVMTALVLLAVLVDRSALSMRTVALAAGGILLLRPEALLGASFQLSFAAVVALIAVYESGAFGLGRRGREGALPRPLLYFAGVALTTLVASTATAPLTVYAFQRFATYGVVANLVAVPLTAFWVMPIGLLGLLLMPLGLDGPCFVLMGLGIELVLATAAAVAAWPGAAVLLGQPPTAAVAAATLGGLWLCLWRRPWRWLGTLGLALGVALAAATRPPDLRVAAGGDLVAVRLEDGRLALAPWRRDAFVTDAWLRHVGQAEAAPWPEPGAGDAAAGDRLRCDALGCIYRKDGHTVALARRPEALDEDCVRAELVVTALRIERCPDGPGSAAVLGGRELWGSDGTALWLTGAGIRRASAAAERGRRPWVRSEP